MSSAIASWAADRGDATPLAWLVTIAYFAGALLSLRAANIDHRERWIWRALALMLVLGGVNKQLDLQTLTIIVARAALMGTSWFAERREVQAVFVAVLALVAVLAGLWLSGRARLWRRPARIAMIGVALTALFWLLRAAQINHMTGGPGADHGGNLQYLELAGVLLTCWAALIAQRVPTAEAART